LLSFVLVLVVPTSQGYVAASLSVFFTPRPGAPKRSDGGLVLEKAIKPHSVLDNGNEREKTDGSTKQAERS
jgi:hypothetical protein